MRDRVEFIHYTNSYTWEASGEFGWVRALFLDSKGHLMAAVEGDDGIPKKIEANRVRYVVTTDRRGAVAHAKESTQ